MSGDEESGIEVPDFHMPALAFSARNSQTEGGFHIPCSRHDVI